MSTLPFRSEQRSIRSLGAPATSEIPRLDAVSEVFVHLASLASVNTNVMVVVAGPLDAGRLKQAFERAVASVDLLGLMPQKYGTDQLEPVGSGQSGPRFDVVSYEGDCDFSDPCFRQLLMLHSQKHPIDWRDGCPAGLLLVHGRNGETSCVYLNTHHAVADARSDHLLFERTIRAYAHDDGSFDSDGQHRSLPFDHLTKLRPDWSSNGAMFSATARAVGTVVGDILRPDLGWRPRKVPFRWATPRQSAGHSTPILDFHHEVLPIGLSDSVHRVAKATRTTVNTIYAAALVRLLESNNEISRSPDGRTRRAQSRFRVTCAVSLRKTLDRTYDQTFRNYLIPSRIRVRGGLDPRELVQVVHDEFLRARSDAGIQTEIARLRLLRAFLRHSWLHRIARISIDICQGSNACYSNPGRIDGPFERFGAAVGPKVTQYVGFGCLVPPYDFILYTPSVGQNTQLDIVYRREAFDDILREFVEPYRAELTTLVNELKHGGNRSMQ